MSNPSAIRWGWLKAMYIYTIVGAGGMGSMMLLFPGATQSAFGYPPQDPFVFGLYASLLFAAGLLAILGLRFPLRFVPLLLIQLVYKPLWLLAVVLPHALRGEFPFYAVVISVIYLTYIIGNLIAIPFGYVFGTNTQA